MNVTIIGLGSIGMRHARNAEALGHSVTGFDGDGAVRPLPCAGSLEMAVKHAEAVLICTPASTHAAVARQLLDAGYRGPLFCEKPLALSVEECAVFEAWPHPTTMVGYNWRFNEEVQQLFALKPGYLRTILSCCTDMRSWPGRSYGDPLLECSHEIDLVLSQSSALETPSVSCWCGYDPDSTFTNNVSLSINGSEVRVNWKANVIETQRSFERGPFRLTPTKGSIEESYRSALRHFLDCAQHCVATMIPFADGIRVVDLISHLKTKAVA